MSYRSGTYIAFHAGGTTDPTASDIKYYRLLKAWHENDDIEFRFVNSHEKVAGVRDTSTKEANPACRS
jgi:antiphage defense system Thoeris ThsB-like protein